MNSRAAPLHSSGCPSPGIPGAHGGCGESWGAREGRNQGAAGATGSSLLLCCGSSPRVSSSNAVTDEIQEKFASSQDAFDDVVKYFGENPKTTPPSVFFPVFVRFVKAYKVNGSMASFNAFCGIIRQAGFLLELCLRLCCSAEASPVPLGSRSGWTV